MDTKWIDARKLRSDVLSHGPSFQSVWWVELEPTVCILQLSDVVMSCDQRLIADLNNMVDDRTWFIMLPRRRESRLFHGKCNIKAVTIASPAASSVASALNCVVAEPLDLQLCVNCPMIFRFLTLLNLWCG